MKPREEENSLQTFMASIQHEASSYTLLEGTFNAIPLSTIC